MTCRWAVYSAAYTSDWQVQMWRSTGMKISEGGVEESIRREEIEANRGGGKFLRKSWLIPHFLRMKKEKGGHLKKKKKMIEKCSYLNGLLVMKIRANQQVLLMKQLRIIRKDIVVMMNTVGMKDKTDSERWLVNNLSGRMRTGKWNSNRYY